MPYQSAEDARNSALGLFLHQRVQELVAALRLLGQMPFLAELVAKFPLGVDQLRLSSAQLLLFAASLIELALDGGEALICLLELSELKGLAPANRQQEQKVFADLSCLKERTLSSPPRSFRHPPTSP